MLGELKVETVIIRQPQAKLAETWSSPYYGFAARSIGPFSGPSELERWAQDAQTFKEVKTSVETLTSSQREELERDPELTSLPHMPFRKFDPLTSTQPATDPSHGSVSWGIDAIGADRLGPDAGQGVTVAVLDTGIQENHDAFRGMNLETRSFVQGEGPEDIDGHGTHCAGTIFGQDVDGVRIGVARGVQRALIGKVLGQNGGGTQTILDGIYWALGEKAQVISMSLGIDFPGYREDLLRHGMTPQEATSVALSSFLENVRAFDRLGHLAGLAGVGLRTSVIVGASGNESDRPHFTVACAPPANGERFISVAALDQSYKVAPFSNTDPYIAAPGVDITSAKLGGGLITQSGTSMAAPHVAGLVCAMLSKTPGLRADDVFYYLRANAKRVSDGAKDVGFGLAQA